MSFFDLSTFIQISLAIGLVISGLVLVISVLECFAEGFGLISCERKKSRPSVRRSFAK